MPANNLPHDLVELGQVSGAYGIRGWVRVRPYAANSQTILQVNKWWLNMPAQSRAGTSRSGKPESSSFVCYKVVKVREHSGQVVARLDGIEDRTVAEQLKGSSVWVSRANFAQVDPNEYYWVDLIGCLLYGENKNQQSELIGEVTGLMDNGAHGILRVARIIKTGPANQGSAHVYKEDKKGRTVEVLVPFVEAHVHTVDLANRKLLSNWPVE